MSSEGDKSTSTPPNTDDFQNEAVEIEKEMAAKKPVTASNPLEIVLSDIKTLIKQLDGETMNSINILIDARAIVTFSHQIRSKLSRSVETKPLEPSAIKFRDLASEISNYLEEHIYEEDLTDGVVEYITGVNHCRTISLGLQAIGKELGELREDRNKIKKVLYLESKKIGNLMHFANPVRNKAIELTSSMENLGKILFSETKDKILEQLNQSMEILYHLMNVLMSSFFKFMYLVHRVSAKKGFGLTEISLEIDPLDLQTDWSSNVQTTWSTIKIPKMIVKFQPQNIDTKKPQSS